MTPSRRRETTQTTKNKALTINRDAQFYGTFAEIGAGQEVARHFFQAGLASQTVAKSMSAYDKVFSDSIYGKGSRFVSEMRLEKMLDHEFNLLQKRLNERGVSSAFFVFADTVATSSHEEEPSCHGWMGVRFQKTPEGPANDVVMHVRMRDRLRLQQQEALGILGVNLVYACRMYTQNGAQFISSLLDNLSLDRIEIEYIKFSGNDLKHIDNRLMSLELVKQSMTHAVMFSPSGDPLCPADALYGQNVLVQRGTFRPVTTVNLDISKRGTQHLTKDTKAKKEALTSLMEITMGGLQKSGKLDDMDFLNRVDTLAATGQTVMVSNFFLYSDLANYLLRKTSEQIALVVGAASLPLIFADKYYKTTPGGMLGALAKLFDARSRLYVYPFKDDKSCSTSRTFFPQGSLGNLYKYFLDSQKIIDMSDCDDLDTSIKAETVRKLLAQKDKSWEKLVPPEARELIKKKKMFQ